ncbi:MAG: YicC family protein [Spirochaetales bacterium]|uniref:YicC family protein n=1 Tax=Candidatus Thalassospirochaeta sargassi TaxID=3119039 RepID=A0AAJ1MP87_9SPIO|nr:YicC family protein [Spirochaetales bacterium]
MKSMTGYGYSEYQDEKIHLILEMKSYNNRYLDIIINQPVFLNALEPEFRKFISDRAERGRVELYLKVRELEEDIQFHLDRSAAESYADILRELKDTAGLDEQISLSHLLSFEGILKTEKKRDIDVYRKSLLPLLEECFSQWDKSRIKEGFETARDIKSNLAVIYDAVELFKKHGDEMENHIKDNIRAKFEDVLGDSIDEQRVLAETAVLLVKYSINEEIIRLKGHLDSFSTAADSGGAVGKKLDFICQEINREVNTIGSKSFVMAINQKVVEVKDALENIREQLRNVE